MSRTSGSVGRNARGELGRHAAPLGTRYVRQAGLLLVVCLLLALLVSSATPSVRSGRITGPRRPSLGHVELTALSPSAWTTEKIPSNIQVLYAVSCGSPI